MNDNDFDVAGGDILTLVECAEEMGKMADRITALEAELAKRDDLLLKLRDDIRMRGVDGVVELSAGLWIKLNDTIQIAEDKSA